MARSIGRRSFLASIAHHNPFYLLSAASMLLACLLLSNTTTWSPIATQKLITLIVTLNVYELLLVGFGLYLIVKRKLRADGRMLLFLEAFFIVDVGFLNSEVYQESLQIGLIVNAVLLVLAAIKLALIFRSLGLALRSGAFGLLLLSIAALMVQPALLKQISQNNNGRVSELAMYAEWWIGSFLLAGFGFVTLRKSKNADVRDFAMASWLYKGVVTLAMLSMAAHLGTSHWVYKTPFTAADLSPVLLAVTVLLKDVPAMTYIQHGEVRLLRWILPIAAMLTSLGNDRQLLVTFAGHAFAPSTFTAAAAYLTVAYVMFERIFARLAIIGFAGGAAYVLGPSLDTMIHWGDRLLAWLSAQVRKLIPDSQVAWGFMTLVAAFVLFAVGAGISMLKDSDTEPPAPPQNDPPRPPDEPMQTVGAQIGIV